MSTTPGPRDDAATPVPLLVTADPDLAAEVRRLVAAAGTTCEVLPTVPESWRAWAAAPLVLVGADVAPLLAASALTGQGGASPRGRRSGVHLLSRGPAPDTLFRAAVALGAETVLELPSAETWLVETLADTLDGVVGRAVTIGVVGGCGGAGATTFAASLALAAASVVPAVTLVDADPVGAGVEPLVGLDRAEGTRWPQLLESAGRLGSRSLRAALPATGPLAVLGWGEEPRTAARAPDGPVTREVMAAAERGSDVVVVDLPRHPDRLAAELLPRLDDVVVLCPMRLSAVASAARVTAVLREAGPAPHLLARETGPLDAEQVAAVLDLPLLTAMRDQRGLADALSLDEGALPRRGPLARAVRVVLRTLAGERPRETVAARGGGR